MDRLGLCRVAAIAGVLALLPVTVAGQTRSDSEMAAPATMHSQERSGAIEAASGPAPKRDSASGTGAHNGGMAVDSEGAKSGAKAVGARPATSSVTTLPKPARDAQMPGQLVGGLLLAALLGAIGGLAAVLVTGDGRLDRLSEDDHGVVLGFASQLIVGAVAAVIVESVNPPDGSWLSLVGGSLAAGVGGQAILLAMVHGKRADVAENQTQQVREIGETNVRSIAETSKRTLLQGVAETNRASDGTKDGMRGLTAGGLGDDSFASAFAAIDAQRDAAIDSLEKAARPIRGRERRASSRSALSGEPVE